MLLPARVLQNQRQACNDEHNRLRFGRKNLISPPLEVAKPAADTTGRHNASPDFVADDDDVTVPGSLRELAHGRQQDVLLAACRRVRLALEEVRQPQGGALHDHRRVKRRSRSNDAGNRFGFLDGGPSGRAVGAMALDAARHLAIARATGGGNVDCRPIANQRLRVPALAAPGPAKHKRQHGPTLAFITRTRGSSPK